MPDRAAGADQPSQAGRVVLAATAVISLASVILAFALVLAGGDAPGAPSTGVAVGRFFSYFTVESNLLVILGAGGYALVRRPPPRWLRVLRVDGVVGIVVTGLVYVTLLRPTDGPYGLDAVSNAGLHYVTPVLALVGFLLVEPRGRVTGPVLRWAMVWPVGYVGWTLAHGAVGQWYPYPFIDVGVLGYPTALRNGIGVLAVILVVALLVWGYDVRMRRAALSRAGR